MQTQHLTQENLATMQGPALTVETIGREAHSAWDAFLVTHADSSFYHLSGWREINERDLGHQCEYLVARRADAGIEGVLPLVYVRSRLFGRILCSMPFVNYGGPVATSPAAATLLAEHAVARANALGAEYLELRCAAPLEVQIPVSLKKISLTVPLGPDPEVLWNAFSSKHRKNVRRAQKNDLTVNVGGIELLDDFYAVLERSWQGLGTPLYRRNYFRHILETFPNNTYLYVCRTAAAPAAAALVGHFNGTVEGMWAGVDPRMQQLQPNYVLYWEMLRHTCLQGHKRFHLGRSTAESGAETFKLKWNAESHQLYWYFHRPGGGAMPELNVDNPKYRLAITLWRKLPLPVTRLLGPPLARLIP